MASNLPLSLFVNVSVAVAQQQAVAPSFNQGCIIGNSGRIPTVGANARIRVYATQAAMLTDGFLTTDPEYIAAGLYFGQSPAPSQLWVGAQDPTAVAAVAVDTGAEGTGYQVGDVLTLAGSGATVQVTSVATGAVTGLTLLTGGTGATVGNGVATTGGHGTGALVNVTALGETATIAATACRAAQAAWYAFTVVSTLADSDHVALAAFAQSASPQSVYIGTTADAAVLAGTANNVLDQLQTASYNRTQMVYATTQTGLYPNNAYAAAAVLGMAMGRNTGLAKSFFTQKFKALSGVAAEPVTQTQRTTIEAANGNLLVGYSSYTFFEQGVMANGQFFDEILGLDMLAAGIQVNIANVLVAQPAVPQTDAGQVLLLAAANRACADSASRGFLGAGVWNGPQVLNLAPGTALPLGYSVQSPSYTTQSSGNRAARQAMPIYACVTEAGAVHSVQITVNVQS